jgi:hypothetical protein
MGRLTLDQVEQLAMQLPAEEQLELAARINEQLSRSGVVGESLQIKVPLSEISPAEWADMLLLELDSIAESIGGEFDSGSEVRQIREGGSGQS